MRLSVRRRHVFDGLSLVEILIAVALLGVISITVTNFWLKSNADMLSVNMRYRQANEVHAVIQDIQADLRRGAYISPNSHSRRLEYTIDDPTTQGAVKKIYTITPVTGSTGPYYLKYSGDGGATFESPYRISGFTRYKLNGSPRFLFAQTGNNCKEFIDDNGNGVLGTGDSTVNTVACFSGADTASTFSSPTQANKVVLGNLQFTSGTGSPEAIRDLPDYIFIAVGPGLVRSQSAAVAGVADSALVQSFSIDGAVNPQFPTSGAASGLTYDNLYERLLITFFSNATVYQTERNGVLIDKPYNFTPGTSIWGSSLAGDLNSFFVAYHYSSYKLSQYNFTYATPLSPISTITLPSLSSVGEVAYNPGTPDTVYVTGDNSTNQLIYELNKQTGATVNTWTLASPVGPGTVTSLTIEPVTGDFLFVTNNVFASGGSNYIRVYRLKRDGTRTSFTINITDLGSSRPVGSGCLWKLAIDSERNRLFLAEYYDRKVYEVVPPVIISPRE